MVKTTKYDIDNFITESSMYFDKVGLLSIREAKLIGNIEGNIYLMNSYNDLSVWSIKNGNIVNDDNFIKCSWVDNILIVSFIGLKNNSVSIDNPDFFPLKSFLLELFLLNSSLLFLLLLYSLLHTEQIFHNLLP